MKHKTYKITIESSDGEKVVYKDIKHKDFNLSLSTDIGPITHIGKLTPSEINVWGYNLDINAYIHNKEEDND